MNNKTIQYRQGDVLIERVSKHTKSTPTGKRVILAHGEATGHAHEVAEPTSAEIIPANGDARGAATLVVAAATSIVHQEHAPIPLARGTYKIVRQVEYTPAEIRRVAD